MTIESGTYISDLNVNYPEQNALISGGDNHLRWIKSALKTTFPNITGAITASHTTINTSIASVVAATANNTADTLVKRDGAGGISTGVVTATGFSTTGNLNFADSGMALFGSGNDLQIYHSGGASFIDDAGTGSLNIRANNLYLQKYTNENYLVGIADGPVSLFYNNSQKFATTNTGIDVIGTATMDSLNVDSGTLQVNPTPNYVGINVSPSYTLDISSGSQNCVAQFRSSDSTAYLAIRDSSTTHNVHGIGAVGNDLTLYANNAERMRVTSSGKIGIGTASPASRLALHGAADVAHIVQTNSANSQKLEIGNAYSLYTGASGAVSAIASDSALAFATNDAERMRIDSSGNVGIGTTSPANTLTVGNLTASANDQDATVGIKCNANHRGIILQENSGAEQWEIGVGAAGALKFYDSGSATPAVTFADETGKVGIGTTSPATKLHISGDGDTNSKITVERTGATTGTNILGYDYIGTFANSELRLFTNSTEKMRITSSGKVGIGTISPLYNLVVNDTASAVIQIRSGNDDAGHLYFADTDDDNIGGVSYNHQYNFMNFKTNDTERMRIDSSGNVLVGKTATGFGTAGIELFRDNQIYATSTTHALAVNRLSTDGAVAKFYKDGTTVGMIGTKDGDIYLGTGDTGLRFYDDGDAIYPAQASNGAGRDNAVDLGSTSKRFKDLHLSGELKGNAQTATTASSCTGNAATATRLATTRTIALSGDVTGSASFNGTSNATINATISDDSHNHTIANIDGLQTELDGKLGSSENATSATTAAACSGNSATATKLATARTLSLSGDVSGSASFDGSGNATITTTISDDSHNHTIANIDGLQAELDGKLASNGNAVSATTATTATTAGACTGNSATATKLATSRTIALSGDVTGSASFDGSGNATISTSAASALFLQIYPVGAIYISTTSTSPATLFGGTWAGIAGGRVLQTAGVFGSAGVYSGNNSRIITESNMPAHTHKFRSDSIFSTDDEPQNQSPTRIVGDVTSSSGGLNEHNPHTTLQNHNYLTTEGSGTAFDVQQASYSVYMWRRTA